MCGSTKAFFNSLCTFSNASWLDTENNVCNQATDTYQSTSYIQGVENSGFYGLSSYNVAPSIIMGSTYSGQLGCWANGGYDNNGWLYLR